MGTIENIDKSLDEQFENHGYLPQKLDLEDFDLGVVNLIKSGNLSIETEVGIQKPVPLIYLTQELWAEKKMNWGFMRNEYGQEVTRPFMAMSRASVKPGTSPLKRSIPVKKKFTWLRVPTFDGTLKGYNLYKVPQPVYVDIEYQLIFVSHYTLDVNDFYQIMLRDIFPNLQAYMNINGYYISARIGDPTENNERDDLNSERIYQISVPITVYAKLVDPKQFEKVTAINKIAVKITEKRD
jgi:hypothetical protein